MVKFLLIFILLLSGCAPEGQLDSVTTTGFNIIGSSVHRWIDEEAGVVCWSSFSGISCLPLNQTLLEH